MTDIPPVEERQVRLCSCCYHCGIDMYGFDECRLHPNYNQRYLDLERPDNCSDNFTNSEIQDLIDQHNAGEQLVRLIELRIDDLDGQLSEGEIKLPLHHALTCELRWILQSIEDFKQQPRQEEQYFEEPEACDMCLKNYGSDACRKATCRFKPRQEGQ